MPPCLRALVRLPYVFVLLACLALAGCQTQRDATAAAQQMSSTAATLRQYYAALIDLVSSNEQAQAAQGYLTGVPLDADTRAQLEDTRAELKKRAGMAADLARLAALFADLANSGAAADAAKAADDLNTELGSIKAIKTGSTETEALKVAVNAIVNAVKAHDEVKAARLMKPLATALSQLFDAEADSCVSFADSYYVAAAANSNVLIGRRQVSNALLYHSSLRPFGLSPEITDPALKSLSEADLQARVADRLADRRAQDRAAATGLSDSLHVMRDRIATVADGKALRATLPPLTLEGVKAWIIEIKTDLGE